jgi:prepilin-type N-terminal cleavage/methylation domain-containing protein
MFVKLLPSEDRAAEGFTVIEIIAVLLVIGVLVSVAATRLVGTGAAAAGEAELLKANLRFAQARAMSEGLQAVWGVQITSTSYTLMRDGAAAPIYFPGEDSSPHALSGATIASGTGTLTFDFFGRPSLGGTVLTANHVITFSGGKAVTVTAHTGLIP